MLLYHMGLFVNRCYIPSGWFGSVIQNLGFVTLSNGNNVKLKKIFFITVHMVDLENRHCVFGIILSPSEYLTHRTLENDENYMIHYLAILLTSAGFNQYNHNILTNNYNSKNHGKAT